MKHIYFVLTFLIVSVALSAQETSVSLWERTLETISLSQEKVYEACPNFPNLTATKYSDQQFTEAIKGWEANYPKEVEAFWLLEEVVRCNPSFYYLGLNEPEKAPVNAFIQWVKASRITENRLNTIAPNFPIDATGDNADFEVKKWIYLYGHEYEILINDRQLTESNPYYDQYIDAIQIPKFVSALVTEERPTYFETGNPQEDELRYQLQLQNWFFVFHPEEFEKEYGFYPVFPEWFNEADYRQQIKDKIAANKEAEEQGLKDDMYQEKN